MPRACSSVSRTVPSGAMTLPGSSISASSAPISSAGQSRSINADARRRRVGAGADQPDHFIDIGDGDGEANKVVGAVARLAEFEAGAAEDDLLAEPDETLQGLAQAHLPRLAVVQRQHVDAEAGLQLGEAEQLVQHHLGGGVALQFHDDAHAGAVALVAHFADAFDDLAAHQFGDFLDQGLLVHLIGDFADDDRGAVLADFLEFGFARGW